MNKDKNECKYTQSYIEDESKNKQQKETRQDVHKVIIDAVGAAFAWTVGAKAQLGSFEPVLEGSQTSLLSHISKALELF